MSVASQITVPVNWKICSILRRTAFPVSWRQSVMQPLIRHTRAEHFRIYDCQLKTRGPMLKEPVLLLEVTNLFYQLQNCSATFGITSRNCWNM
jgi:hypothetical protein